MIYQLISKSSRPCPTSWRLVETGWRRGGLTYVLLLRSPITLLPNILYPSLRPLRQGHLPVPVSVLSTRSASTGKFAASEIWTSQLFMLNATLAPVPAFAPACPPGLAVVATGAGPPWKRGKVRRRVPARRQTSTCSVSTR